MLRNRHELFPKEALAAEGKILGEVGEGREIKMYQNVSLQIKVQL